MLEVPLKPPPLAGSQKELQAFLERRHPDYERLLEHWNFLEMTYEGGREWFAEENGNIFKYIKEGETEFTERVARAYRFNHTREVTDLVQKYIFKTPIVRNTENAPEPVKTFWEKATEDDMDIGQFMKVASTQASVLGRPWIFTDTNIDPNAPVPSIADAKKAGAHVYAYIVKPQDLLNMGYSKGGENTWVLVREWVVDDDDPVMSTGGVGAQYRLWTKYTWHLFEIMTDPDGKTVTVVEMDQGWNPIKRVPGFPLPHVLGVGRYSAPGLISDIAYLDRTIANYLSNLDAIIQDQSFSQLAMPAQSVLPGTDAHNAAVEAGTKRVFLYDGEGGAAPTFLSPDPRQAGMIVTVINKIISEIYHTIGMAGEHTKSDAGAGMDNSSGVAKAFDFDRMNSLLTSKADALENAENQLIELVMLWNSGEYPKEELVKYPDTFDVRSLFDELMLAEKLALVDAPPEIRREQMKQLVGKLFPRLDAASRTKMEKALETWPIHATLDGIIGKTSDTTLIAAKTGAAAAKEKQVAGTNTKPASQNRQGQRSKTSAK